MRAFYDNLLRVVVAAMCALALVGCNDEGGNENEGGGEQIDATTPQALGEVTTYLTDNKISGFSGVCLNENGTGLYGVADDGDIYNISFEGEKLGKLPLNVEKDFEGVTTDATNKVVYTCEEREWAIYQLNSEKSEATKIANINVENGVENKGLEGIAYGKGNLYVANQQYPTTIFTYTLSEGKVTDSVTVDFAKFLSDLCYDETNDTLWCVDSKQQLLFNIALDGELLATYDVSFVPKPEGICVDYQRGVMWFACDSTGRLFSAKFNPSK